ncbi:hypothetical protein [Accumulibacter sp.]|uniref:hypothetical protein n=1 Tax=Accumulibacter sp. TaxID=2053492 RepID=UPI00287AE3F7|nr:hypothetical protein [Accumulibacter sp.]MDS4056451.1 hypothetical protein [Accumulibacter sp.]HMW56389.1 hypothetical protein [Accumulibacter sp.]HMW79181.1 hypothetical protein [Accumulibacter sp.]HNC66170.1 hypothetical protein [Thauera aminoaromatica]
MTLQVDLWSLVGLLFGLITTLAGLGLTFARMLLGQVEQRLDERFQALQKSREDARSVCISRFQTLDQERREEIAQWQRVERDLLALRAELPLHYVRREDYVRGQTVVEAKLDALALKLENLQLRTSAGDRRRADHPNDLGVDHESA